MILTDEQYQKFTVNCKNNLVEHGADYALLEMYNELGELFDVIKKYIRDNKTEEEVKERVKDEMGDFLWSWAKYIWYFGHLPSYQIEILKSYNRTFTPLELKEILLIKIRKLTMLVYHPTTFQTKEDMPYNIKSILHHFGLKLDEVLSNNYKKLVTKMSTDKTKPHLKTYTVKIEYEDNIEYIYFNKYQLTLFDNNNEALSYVYSEILRVLEENKQFKHNLKEAKISIKKTVYFLTYLDESDYQHYSSGLEFLREGATVFSNRLGLNNE